MTTPENLAPDEEARLDRLVAGYLRGLDRDEPEDRARLLAENPDLADALRQYWEMMDLVEHMAGPTGCETTPPAPPEDTPCPAAPTAHPGPWAEEDLPLAFGRYQVLRPLGRGGMGAVYLARDTHLARDVALKVPVPGGGYGPESLDRFQREARAAAALRHPNVCPIFDAGVLDGQPFISMDYVEGRPLADLIVPGQPLPERAVASLLFAIARAMAVAHAAGVVHRDLKPTNVMVDQTGQPVVLDFGLARCTAGGDVRLTRSGTVLGTPAYMSPEQAEGDPEQVGPASDLYSLGVIGYELLTGRLPFCGGGVAALNRIRNSPPEPPSKLRPGLDPRLETLCLRLLAMRPVDRYPSMQALAEDLERFLAEGLSPDGLASDLRRLRQEVTTASRWGAVAAAAVVLQGFDEILSHTHPPGGGAVHQPEGPCTKEMPMSSPPNDPPWRSPLEDLLHPEPDASLEPPPEPLLGVEYPEPSPHDPESAATLAMLEAQSHERTEYYENLARANKEFLVGWEEQMARLDHDSAASRHDQADDLHRLALGAIEQGEYDRAEDHLKDADDHEAVARQYGQSALEHEKAASHHQEDLAHDHHSDSN